MNFNISKSSNFNLTLRNDLKQIEFNCQGVNLPGISLGQINMPFFGQTNEIPGDSISWNPLSVNVLCDEDFNAFFEAFDLMTKTKKIDGTYNLEIATFDAILMLATNKNNIKRIITFKNAWITDISDLTFETTGDDSFLTFSLTLKYTTYNYEKV
jgi:hypothetical protein